MQNRAKRHFPKDAPSNPKTIFWSSEQNEEKFNDTNNTSFLRGYNTSTRKQESNNFVRRFIFLNFVAVLLVQQDRTKTQQFVLEF